MKRQYIIIAGSLLILIAGYWLLPISGDVFVMLNDEPSEWPRIRFEPEAPRPGERATAILADTVPWVHVKALVDGGQEAQFLRYEPNPLGGEWFWSFTVPQADSYELRFFHDCDQGCIDWASETVNTAVNANRFPSELIPTKLGVVFPNPDRDWHNRSGWVVELTYVQQDKTEYWGVDDLAARIAQSVNAGQRVLIRIDYDQDQSLPHDEAALAVYLEYVRRLVRDDRLNGAYALIIGSSYNAEAGSRQGGISPEWYARLFNGFGTAMVDRDNVLAVVRAENPALRVLVGPVQPWVAEQDGARPFTIDAPWLNYFHTLVAALVDGAEDRATAGIAAATPDGFAIQAPGRPDAPELTPSQRPQEPMLDLRRGEWGGAQAGFRVYQDWLAVINAFPATQGAPVFITASNTFTGASVPAQNYPPGWLTAAHDEISAVPQIRALIWFLDELPVDNQWAAFSLTEPQGKTADAAAEYDRLLRELIPAP